MGSDERSRRFERGIGFGTIWTPPACSANCTALAMGKEERRKHGCFGFGGGFKLRTLLVLLRIRGRAFRFGRRHGLHIVVKRQSLPLYVHQTLVLNETRLELDDPGHFCLKREWRRFAVSNMASHFKYDTQFKHVLFKIIESIRYMIEEWTILLWHCPFLPLRIPYRMCGVKTRSERGFQ